MKKILIVTLLLSGCASQGEYLAYIQAHQAVETARRDAETAKYRAMSDIAASGSETAKVAAVIAIMQGRGNAEQAPAMQAPKSASETALQWASILVPTLANVGAQVYSVKQQTRLGMRQSDNATALGIAQSNNAVLSTNSTNAAFTNISANGVNGITTVAGNSYRSLDLASNNTAAISTAGLTTAGNIAEIGLTTANTIAADGLTTARNIAASGLTASKDIAGLGLKAATDITLSNNAANVTVTKILSDNNAIATLAGYNAATILGTAGLATASTISWQGTTALTATTLAGFNAERELAANGLTAAQYIASLIRPPVVVVTNPVTDSYNTMVTTK